MRSVNSVIGAADGFGGAEPIPLNAAGDATLPGIYILSLPYAESPNPPEFQNNNLFSFNDDLTYVQGRNNFKFGFWVRRVQDNPNLQPLSSGVYFFNTVADLLNNSPSTFFNQAAETDFGVRFTNFAFYGQDDIRITPRLKLNLGLRYELDTVPTEAHGRFSPLVGLNDIATATLGTPGAPVHNGNYDDFAPRIGFAYQLTSDAKTVLRGGTGIFYDLPSVNATQLAFGPPFKITNLLLGSALGGPVTVPVNPALLITTITGMPPFGSAELYDPTNFRTPFSYQYNLNLQRQLDSKTVVQASYVGSLGRHLIHLQPLNLLNPATGMAPNPNFSAGALELIETNAVSNYNAFQANVTRRLDHGLELTVFLHLGAFAGRRFQRHRHFHQLLIHWLESLRFSRRVCFERFRCPTQCGSRVLLPAAWKIVALPPGRVGSRRLVSGGRLHAADRLPVHAAAGRGYCRQWRSVCGQQSAPQSGAGPAALHRLHGAAVPGGESGGVRDSGGRNVR